MANSSLLPILDLEVPDIAGAAWVEVARRALVRAGEITRQRTNYEKITNRYHDDWQFLHRFEYDHFYSAWVGVAYRLRACAIHSEDFTAVFQKTRGTTQGEDGYQEDDALFGFFVKGLAALESFYYGLYALGALISTPTQKPSVPPSAQFPLLTHLVDPSHRQNSPRFITPEKTYNAYTQVFPGLPLIELLGAIREDAKYKEWSDIRNILAHRVATAGRTIQMGSPNFSLNVPPISVKPWGMDLSLDETTTTSRYRWLSKTINGALETTAMFATQQLPYTDDQLDEWTRRPTGR
jgi:hypothetical protein